MNFTTFANFLIFISFGRLFFYPRHLPTPTTHDPRHLATLLGQQHKFSNLSDTDLDNIVKRILSVTSQTLLYCLDNESHYIVLQVIVIWSSLPALKVPNPELVDSPEPTL